MVRDDIDRQKATDQRKGTHLVAGIYSTRVEAVEAARQALDAGEEGAEYALRQALIDLAARCEDEAAQLPEPTRP